MYLSQRLLVKGEDYWAAGMHWKKVVNLVLQFTLGLVMWGDFVEVAIYLFLEGYYRLLEQLTF